MEAKLHVQVRSQVQLGNEGEHAMAAHYGGRLSRGDVHQSVRAWIGHVAYGDTWRLRERIFESLVFARGAAN